MSKRWCVKSDITEIVLLTNNDMYFFFKIRGLEQWESSLQQRTTTCHAAVTPAESKSNFVFQGIAN